MSQPRSFLETCGRSARVLALLLASTSAPSLLAAELKFEKPDDFKTNFAEPTTKGALSVVTEEKGVLRFSSGDGSIMVRTAFAPSGKRADLVDEKITAKFRFKQPHTSFGVMSRAQKEESDCYVALVNIGPNGGILRLFKGQPQGSYADGAVATQQSAALKPRVWYRLETSTTNKGNGVVVQAELKPANGGRAIMSVEWEDKTAPLTAPGHVQLRFYSGEPGGEVDVKELSIKPDPKLP